ncbi:MAG: phosphate butyryltransferase, partial [Thermotogae bacterium]
MIRHLTELVDMAKGKGKKLVVAAAEDHVVLKAVSEARKAEIADPILVGNREKMEKEAEVMGLDLKDYEIVEAENELEAAKKAVEMVSKGQGDFLMKGKIKTGDLMRTVLAEEYGLRTGKVMAMVSVFEIPNFDRLLIISDAGMLIAPTLEQKVHIIEHSVSVAKVLGIELPKVAVVGAVEVVNPKMPATLDAAILSKMNQRGQIKGCIVDGPFALDNVVSEEAAKHKGIESPVAGKADIIVTPDIEAGNILYKALIFLAGAKV